MKTLIKHYRQLLGMANSWAMDNLPTWDDEAHRLLIQRYGATEKNGRISSTTMTVPQMGAALDDYTRRGWPRHERTFNTGRAKVEVPEQIALMVKLWGKLGAAGKLDNPTREGLLVFCSRQCGGVKINNLDEIEPQDKQQIIEALKAWLARQGVK